MIEISQQQETEALVLYLYIAGAAPNSTQAVANLEEIKLMFPKVTFEIEVIDTLVEPLRALNDGILVTPTLVKTSPTPETKIIGNLSRRGDVLLSLNLVKPGDDSEP